MPVTPTEMKIEVAIECYEAAKRMSDELMASHGIQTGPVIAFSELSIACCRKCGGSILGINYELFFLYVCSTPGCNNYGGHPTLNSTIHDWIREHEGEEVNKTVKHNGDVAYG